MEEGVKEREKEKNKLEEGEGEVCWGREGGERERVMKYVLYLRLKYK